MEEEKNNILIDNKIINVVDPNNNNITNINPNIVEESIETSSILEYLTNPTYYNIISKNKKIK